MVSKLTEFALGEMKKEGITIVRIHVYSNNLSSINTIQKMYFVRAGAALLHHRDLSSGTYVDDLILHKVLL